MRHGTKRPSSEPYTDLGNARRFVSQHGHEVRYCKAWGRWLFWDGARWAIDDTGAIERLAKDSVRAMYSQASRITDSFERQEAVQHGLKSEYAGRIDAMIRLAQTESGVPVRPVELDQDRYLFNCRNGTVDLRTGALRTHRHGDLTTRLVPLDFDPRATCPTFDSFLDRIMGRDTSLVQYLQRCIGYALTGDASEQVMFVLFGSGANGKTTLLEAIRYILGDYAGQVPVRTLMIKREDGVSNDIAQLKGLRFVTASEVEAGQRLAEAQVKQLTGGGTLQARFLYHEPFEFEPTHKLFMDCNHKPEIRGTDPAIWRRIRLIPFNVSIPDSEKDKKLLEKLKAEAPGILAWAVRGCLDWQHLGLDEPASVKAATGEYREEMDLAKQFVKEECTLHPATQETVDRLYGAFVNWCRGRGEGPLSKKAFGATLKDMGGLTQGKLGGDRCWKGIGLDPAKPGQKAA